MNLTLDHAPGELAAKAPDAVRRLLALAHADGPVDAAAVLNACGHDCDHHDHGDALHKAARSTEAGARKRTAREMGSEIQTQVGRALYDAGISAGEAERRAMLKRLRARLED